MEYVQQQQFSFVQERRVVPLTIIVSKNLLKVLFSLRLRFFFHPLTSLA